MVVVLVVVLVVETLADYGARHGKGCDRQVEVPQRGAPAVAAVLADEELAARVAGYGDQRGEAGREGFPSALLDALGEAVGQLAPHGGPRASVAAHGLAPSPA